MRCFACDRLWSAKRVCAHLSVEGTSSTSGTYGVWRFVASVPFDRRMVSLAITGLAEGEIAAEPLASSGRVRHPQCRPKLEKYPQAIPMIRPTACTVLATGPTKPVKQIKNQAIIMVTVDGCKKRPEPG